MFTAVYNSKHSRCTLDMNIAFVLVKRRHIYENTVFFRAMFMFFEHVTCHSMKNEKQLMRIYTRVKKKLKQIKINTQHSLLD